MKTMTEEKLKINLELNGIDVERFKVVKEKFGVGRNTNVLRMLIGQECDRIQEREKAENKKLWIDQEIYALLEERAKQESCSVDELVNRTVRRFLELAKTNLKAKN
jgi:hypothetical protein